MAKRLLVALLLTACAACGGGDDEPGPSPTTTAVPTPAGGPSQTTADAQRDGVPPEIAALTYPERVQERARMRAPEGTWVISRFFEPLELPAELQAEYGELLLLDRDETRIVRAFPFEAVPPTWITMNDDALYCGRAGDGGLPYSMVCRIDRETLASVVKIYTDELGTWIPSDHPSHWEVIGYYLEMYDLVVDDRALYALAGNETWTWLDPNTLTVVQHGTQAPASPRPRTSARPFTPDDGRP